MVSGTIFREVIASDGKLWKASVRAGNILTSTYDALVRRAGAGDANDCARFFWNSSGAAAPRQPPAGRAIKTGERLAGARTAVPQFLGAGTPLRG